MSQGAGSRDEHHSLGLESGLQALRQSPEFRGPVEPLDAHQHSNDHLALIYEDQDEQFDAAVPFVRQGLERDERCMYIADENSREDVLDALRAGGVDVDEALESGALTVHTERDTYRRNGTFDPEDMIEFLRETIDEATQEYESLRIAAEMTWVLGDEPDVEALVEYEAEVNRLFPDVDSIALCQYNRERFPAQVIRDVVRTHPHLVHDGKVCQNVYYTPPEEFFGPEQAAREVDRMMSTLRDRTEAKAKLEERERYQRRLYEITASPDLSFDEKITRLLDLGRERFDLDIGMLTRERTEAFEIETMRGSHPELEEGVLTPPMTDNYCRRVVTTGETHCVADAGEAGWSDDALYREFDLQCYAGVEVGDDESVYGTICFTGLSPREQPFTEAEQTFLELMGQYVSYELEQKNREDRLTALNSLSRELMNTDTATETSEIVVGAAEDTLDLSVTAIALYDEDEGRLEPVAQTDAARKVLEAGAVLERGDSVGWEAFVQERRRHESDPLADTGTSVHPTVSELVAFPLSRQGVLLVGSTQMAGFSQQETEFVETVAANTSAALERVHREGELQDREETLSEQNETLERLNRINDTIRSIDQALVQASSRAEIETAVCEELADVGPYELAWVGNADGMDGEVTPREFAGADHGYLDDITITLDDSPEGQGPTGQAAKTGEPRVVNDILNDPSFRPWRQDALNRGYHAMMSLPLDYDDSTYGVLNIYAAKPGVFDELEQTVLSELSDNIAYAINAIESKKALVNNEVTELEFTIDDLELAALTERRDCELSLQNVVPRSDGSLRVYCTTRGLPGEEILDHLEGIPMYDADVVSKTEEDDGPVCLVEATLFEESLPAAVFEHGGRLRELQAAGGEVTVTVHLGADADVRTFVETLQTKYEHLTLNAKRTREQVSRVPSDPSLLLPEDLTPRQREVLQTAYHSGLFDRPRKRTEREIAESMGISQPTFNRHLRTAQYKLYRELFEDDALLN